MTYFRRKLHENSMRILDVQRQKRNIYSDTSTMEMTSTTALQNVKHENVIFITNVEGY